MSATLDQPTKEQERILGHESGPLRIAAGAGTGKTGTLQRTIVERIERGARPGEILCLTFTVEATKEMRRRVLNALRGHADIDPDELTVQTYHAFAASIVREHALLLGLDGDAALLDAARSWQLAVEALDECSFEHLEIGWMPTFVGKVLTLTEEMLRHVVSPEELREWCLAQGGDDVALERLDAIGAVECYRSLKRERNAIDFGDQIALAVDLLRTHPEVLERLQARFRYVFLDEYQDTDVAQRELVKLVATGADIICAVGDVDQGIFGWRGATIHNMFAFGDDFPGTRFETLSVNFRSGRAILDLANALIEEWERPGDEKRALLRPADDAPDAVVEAFVSPHQLDEAEEIARLVDDGGPPWSQYAVLVRTRGQLDPIYRALVARRIPVEVDTLGGFWTRPEILDVVAWLRVLDDPGDNLALTRLLFGPAYRLSRRDLYFLAARAKDENRRSRQGDRDVVEYRLVDAIVAHHEIAEVSEEARERIGDLRSRWRELAALATQVSLADLVGEIARSSGLTGELAASPNPEASMALRHLAKLRDLAQGYQPVAGSLDLAGFVDYLDSLEEADQDEDELRATEENAVTLMTLHRAKGLEWDVVFLPGLVKGQMPHPGKGGNNPAERWQRLPFDLRGDRDFLPSSPPTKEDLDRLRDEEERRLMYVGITRAKRKLVLSRSWYYRDNIRPKEPSPYWDEAVATGLMDVRELECPPENPYSVGVDLPADPEQRFQPPPRDKAETARIEAELESLREQEAYHPPVPPWHPPAALSVTALLTFLRDPDEFFWRYVRRVPSPPSPAARLGTELHRRIELQSRSATAPGSVPDEIEEPYDLDRGERRGDGRPVTADELWANFEASRFAKLTPLMVEQPFTLYIGEGISVQGRIDAIFERDDGVWELVDYKTGGTDPDPLQLAIYAMAVEEIWARRAVPMWLLLRTGEERAASPVESIDQVLGTTTAALKELR
ncbi:MAG: ATP-dependent helicase [Actinomycetota bacterium]|nr:ATP-dependent helicase [Actinomycetota bacterium]